MQTDWLANKSHLKGNTGIVIQMRRTIGTVCMDIGVPPAHVIEVNKPATAQGSTEYRYTCRLPSQTRPKPCLNRQQSPGLPTTKSESVSALKHHVFAGAKTTPRHHVSTPANLPNHPGPSRQHSEIVPTGTRPTRDTQTKGRAGSGQAHFPTARRPEAR